MKIGLSIAFKGQNYGMLLQAFATQQILENFGNSTQIIDYERTSIKGIRFTPYLLFYGFDLLKNKYIYNKNDEKIYPEKYILNKNLRIQCSQKFIDNRLHNIVKCKGIESLKELGRTYDVVLVGSDQLWTPNSVFGNLRTLRFVPKDVLKISYATSLGVSKYPFYCKSSARQFLSHIDKISVRERQGKKIVEELCNKSVLEVLDPTYLLTKKQWEDLIPYKKEFNNSYVLCYFLGTNLKSKLLAKKFAEEKGLKIVTILSNESYTPIDFTFADFTLIGTSPEKFVNLIRGADYIFTDSFHGVAFSIINEKQFYVTYRNRVGLSSRNSRIDNILDKFKLNTRLFFEHFSLNHLDAQEINYSEVSELVERNRIKSLSFLACLDKVKY